MTPQALRRKLAAILSADVKGYSRLMGDDEERTVRTLNAYKEIIRNLVGQHRGRVVDATGDNLLAEFASVVDAVQCAVEIQQALKAENTLLPETRRMEFRIGINLGDVIEEGDAIYGEGVNIAARMEGLAEAGGICLSGSAYDQIENKLPLGYEYLGEHEVKNIAKPVRVYRARIEPDDSSSRAREDKKPRKKILSRAGLGIGVILVAVVVLFVWRFFLSPASPALEVASMEKMAHGLPYKPSIAVLPFVNLSDDPKQELLADGITEEITTTLSKIPELFVIAKYSASVFKGKTVNLKQVSQELGVKYVLEGSLQSSGNRLRVNVQLIDATLGHHVWSEKYDREMKDFFGLSDEVARNIAVALQVKLTEGEQAVAFFRDTDNLEAWALATQALYLMQSFTRESTAKSRELAEEAAKLDPRFGMAWSLMAHGYFTEARMGWCESPKEYFEKAVDLNRKALALNKELYFAIAMLGQIHLAQGHYDQAIELGRKAVALGPSQAYCYMVLGGILRYAGSFDEAIKVGETSMRLHPSCPWYYCFDLAMSYRMAGRYEEALALLRHSLERAPKEDLIPLPIHVGFADVYSEMGRAKEARVEAEEVLRMDPGFSLEDLKKTEPFRDAAYLKERLASLRKAGLK
jgi:adenylate cyclase